MAKVSQTVKEIVQVVVFLIVVGSLLVAFVAYPLNRTKAITGRSGLDDYDPDSLAANDPTPFIETGFVVDTFRVEADGLTSLACIYLTPAGERSSEDSAFQVRGTAVLLHDERFDRLSMLPIARALIDSGFAVVLYDQRACGLTTGEYHSDGQYEASDLGELVGHLGIRDLVQHPFVAIGWAVGGDAALLAALEEPRLDAVMAIEPYLTTERWFDMLFEEHDTYWIPFPQTIFSFWYDLRSGYAAPVRGLNDTKGVGCRTLILASPDNLADPEYARLAELSDAGKLTTAPLPADPAALTEAIVRFVQQSKPAAP